MSWSWRSPSGYTPVPVSWNYVEVEFSDVRLPAYYCGTTATASISTK
jgi:hypothetical protein